jgi:hypothetical protein
MAEGGERTVKTVLQISLLRSYWPYLLLSLAGVADLATTLIGVRALGLTEGNPRFTPFLTQTVIILYIFVIRKISAFPKRTEKVCETGLVIYSFSPVIWNLFLILIRLFA